MPFKPPYRLETEQEVRDYFRGSRRAGAEDVLAFARAHAIEKPQILARIPAQFKVEILDVKRDFRRVVRPADHAVDVKAVVDFVDARRRRLLGMLGEPAPPDRAALNACLVHEGHAVISALRPRAGSRGKPRDDVGHRGSGEEWRAALDHVLDLRDLLGELMRRWLNTRDRAVRAYLEKALSVPLLYDRVSGEPDHECVRQLRSLPDRSTLLIHHLHDLFGERLAGAADGLYRPALYAFVRAACRRVLSLTSPPNLRRGVVTLIESIHRGEDAAAVRARLDRLCAVHQPRTDEKSLRRIADVVENLLEKLAAFEMFFKVTFARDRLGAYHRAFCRKSHVEEVTVETVLGRKVLTLYPCKDYHEFLKGRYSHDCTRDPALAGCHLRNPRFFNLRIFLASKWIGNIYMLDYTSVHHAVILDRIQIASTADLMPADFFPQLMTRLEAVVTGPGGLKLLGPSVVSSFAPIQQSYLRYRSHVPTVRIRPPMEDQSFEGVQNDIFYVLSKARPLERDKPKREVGAPANVAPARQITSAEPTARTRTEPTLFSE